MKLTGASASYEFKDKLNTYRVNYTTSGKAKSLTSIAVYLNGGYFKGYTSERYAPSRANAIRLINRIS